MSQRNSATGVFRPDLGNAALVAAANQNAYVALRVFPPVPVSVMSGTYARPTDKSWLSREITDRAAGANPVRSQHRHELVNVNLVEYCHEEPLDKVRQMDLASAYDIEAAAVVRGTEIVLRDYEIDALGQLNTTNFSGSANTTSVATPWTNSATATPISNIAAALDQIRAKGGNRGRSFALMTAKKARDAYLTTQLTGRLAGATQLAGRPTEEQMAVALGVEEVILADGVFDANGDGLAIAGTSIWTDAHVFVGYKRDDADFITPQIGRTFLHTGMGTPLQPYVYDEPNGKIRVVQVTMAAVAQRNGTISGHLLTNC